MVSLKSEKRNKIKLDKYRPIYQWVDVKTKINMEVLMNSFKQVQCITSIYFINLAQNVSKGKTIDNLLA